MNVRIYVPIYNFNLDEEFGINVGLFQLIKGYRLQENLGADTKFIEQAGKIAVDNLIGNYMFYFEGEISELSQNPELSTNVILRDVANWLTNFISYLWIVKNNSVFVNTCYLHLFENDKVEVLRTHINFSNAGGEGQITSFSKDELLTYRPLYEKFETIMSWTKDQIDLIKILNPDNAIQTTAANFLEYNKSRIARAVDFIILARSLSFLISKISFNISAFECLFTSHPTEVTHKVCERASIFIGGNPDEKTANYEAIYDAYNVRSKYLHGNILKYTRDKLIMLSTKTDKLLRLCILKIVNENEDLFHMPETDGNIKKFENHFKNMLFNQ